LLEEEEEEEEGLEEKHANMCKLGRMDGAELRRTGNAIGFNA